MSIERKLNTFSFFSKENAGHYALMEVLDDQFSQTLDPRDVKKLSLTNKTLHEYPWNTKRFSNKAAHLPKDLAELYLNAPFYTFEFLKTIANFRQWPLEKKKNCLSFLAPEIYKNTLINWQDSEINFLYQGIKEKILKWDKLPYLWRKEFCSLAGLFVLRNQLFSSETFYLYINEIGDKLTDHQFTLNQLALINKNMVSLAIIGPHQNLINVKDLKSLNWLQCIFLFSPYGLRSIRNGTTVENIQNANLHDLMIELNDPENISFLITSLVGNHDDPKFERFMYQQLLETLENGCRNEKRLLAALKQSMNLYDSEALSVTDEEDPEEDGSLDYSNSDSEKTPYMI